MISLDANFHILATAHCTWQSSTYSVTFDLLELWTKMGTQIVPTFEDQIFAAKNRAYTSVAVITRSITVMNHRAVSRTKVLDPHRSPPTGATYASKPTLSISAPTTLSPSPPTSRSSYTGKYVARQHIHGGDSLRAPRYSCSGPGSLSSG